MLIHTREASRRIGSFKTWGLRRDGWNQPRRASIWFGSNGLKPAPVGAPANHGNSIHATSSLSLRPGTPVIKPKLRWGRAPSLDGALFFIVRSPLGFGARRISEPSDAFLLA